MQQMALCTIYARAKVNLGLRITHVRPNGYHELDSFFYPLQAPYDVLHIYSSALPGLHLTCDAPGIDSHNNTLCKAYTLFQQAAGSAPDIALYVEKGIPLGAGLGGGSSDAAALLSWLNTQISRPLSPEKMATIALSVGADTPFFFYNSLCHVRGIGENITPCRENPFAGLGLLLLCPALHVSTQWAYKTWDNLPAQEKLQKNLTKIPREDRSANSCVSYLYNAFESAVFPAFPALRQLKDRLLAYGALNAVLSGSGSSLVGLFRDKDTADYVSGQFATDVPFYFTQEL